LRCFFKTFQILITQVLRLAHPLPQPFRICVIIINALYARAGWFRRVVEANVQLLGFDRMTRRGVIREQESHTRIFLNQRAIDSLMQTVDERLSVAKFTKQLERTI